MARPASSSAAPRAAESSAPARLALAEYLIASDDAAECAQRAVDWLAQHAGAKAAVCALLDPDTDELRPLAGCGVSAAQLKRLAVHRDQDEHPFSSALSRSAPIVFQNGKARAAAPFGPGPFLAVPLPIAERPEARIGHLRRCSIARPAGWPTRWGRSWCSSARRGG